MNQLKKIITFFYLLLALALSLISYILFFSGKPSRLEFMVFDVGQGDAILIRTPDQHNILIDGGPDNNLVYKLGKYLPFYQRQIDLMILSHPQNDHLIGFNEVLKRYDVKAVLLTGVKSKSISYQIWQQLIEREGTEKFFAGKIKQINISPAVNLVILYPTKPSQSNFFKDLNDSSLLVKFNYGSVSILLTGDATKKIENLLLDADADLAATILKIGHHGSVTSSGQKFLTAINPQLAVISVGENKFGQPAPAVLSQLAALGITTLITKQSGDIVIQSDGQRIFPPSP